MKSNVKPLIVPLLLLVAAVAYVWFFRDTKGVDHPDGRKEGTGGSEVAGGLAPGAPRANAPVAGSVSKETQEAGLPNLDRRALNAVASETQRAALAALRDEVPGVTADFDRVTGTAKWIAAPGVFLDPGTPGGDAVEIVRDYVARRRDLLGHGPEAMTEVEVTRDDVTKHNGMRTLVWQQRFAGLRVFGARFKATVTRSGELVNVGSQLVPDLAEAAAAGTPDYEALLQTPTIAAAKAVAVAGQDLGEAVPEGTVRPVAAAEPGPERKQAFRAALLNEATARLQWLPMSADAMRPVWEVVLVSKARGEMHRVLVDAGTGEPLLRQSLTESISEASYRVFTEESPTPMQPTHSSVSLLQPAAGSRSLIVTSAFNTTASPNGWIDDGVNETRGNNVEAHTDRDGDNTPDLPRPQGSPARVFDPPLNLTQDPVNYRDAAVVQLFYYCNMIHDRFYDLGFTESAGNFQTNNFGRGGLGNDPVLADAQDNAQNGSRNNANFQTPEDGSPGRMQMYLWTSPNPDRDSSFDGLIVVHEYAHGLTNRLVGGGAGITDWHSRGMGEGWSDFYALALLTPASADPQAAYAKAGYSTYQLSRLGEANHYFGIRRYPYSVDTTMNPLRFGDIDLSIDRAYPEVPLNPNTTNLNTPSVHREGEVWCGMLWDMRANLIARYGAVAGNDLALRLVTDALKLSPANPTFVQARDAILQADLVNSGGLNRGEIWTAFAKRKMGSGAVAPPGGNLYTIGVVESATVPDALEVSNLDGWNFHLDPGGTTSASLTLRNTGTSSINWSATPGAAWLQASPASGSLAAGASTTLTVQASAAGLAPGRRSTMLLLRNEGTAFNQPVGARLNLAPPAVVRFNLETDPGWARSGEWAYGTPQGGGGAAAGGAGYPDPTVAATGAKVLGVNLSGNHSVAVTGPDYVTLGPVNLSTVRNTRLRFRQWLNMQPMTFANATIDISTDGTTWRSLFATDYSGAADDAWRRMEYEIGTVADQQATVYVRWGHQTLASPTAYSGWNLDDIEILGEPVGAALSLTFADSVNENAGPLTATLGISAAQASPLTVSLASADPSAATVPATVTIPANQTSVSFAITPVNDAVADGHQTATITATATGIAPVVKDLAVLDDESSTLVLTAPTVVTEGSGTVEASVRLTTASPRDQVVTLQSDNAALTVTASVLIPANSTAPVTLLLNAPDNTLFEGPKTVQLTAAIAGWASASATVTVADDESPRLTLTGPATAAEGDTPRTLTVAINASLGTDLTVNLASSNTGKVTVASSVVIPAGQQSTTFSATIVNNALRDGSLPATVTASAAGYQSGALDLTIRDNDADSYTFASIASPQRRNNPFVVTLTARDVNGEIIATPAGSVTLSGTAASGTVAFSPTAVGTFSNGIASVSPTFTAAATGIVLTATDSFGRTGQSNAFDVVAVTLDHFDWSGLPPGGAVNARLNATVTAKDDSDAVSTGFNGSASLRAHVLYYDRTIGSPTTSSPQTSQVFNTAAQDSRATLLYTAEELGGAPGWLGAISFTVAAGGSPLISNFNIRMKLSPRTTMEGAAWETDGWTTVFTAPTQSGSTPNFAFTRPFWFDGTSSVLVDISFDNSTTGTATTLRYTPSANPRVLYGTSASAHGNPLNWSATTGPATQTSTELPAMDIYFARDLGQVPGSPAGFSSGVWTGQVAIPALGSTRRSLGDTPVGRSAWMLASEASGAMGFSPRISVTTVTTLPPSSSETIFSDNFESGSTLGPAWSTAGSFPIQGAPPNAPRAAITTVGTPRGTQHLVLDSSIVLSGFQAVLSAAELSLNLTGRSNVTLEYWAKFMTGEVANNAPGTQPFTTSAGIFDGIAISADGTNWYLAAPTIYAEPLGAGAPNFILPTTYTAMRRVVLDPIVQRYGLSYNSTFRIKFLCVTGRPAPDAGIAIDDVVVKANATTAPALELPAQFAEGGTQNITVRLPSAPASNVTVNLVSNAPARLTVPASVIVLAGQTTATTSISAPDNGFLDSGGGFGAIVTVTASGYPTSYANTFITDNETGTISLSLPAQITEGIDPPTNAGTVSISPAPTEDIAVSFTISDPAEAFITGTVNGSTTIGAATILAGTGSGRVRITAYDDSRLDGQQSITVTASAPGATSGSTTVLVNDNETRTLSLNMQSLITEGGTGGGSVIIPGSMTTPLVVNLASSNPSKLTVPATVTINAGNMASGFTVTTLNDTTDDGDLAVFITASAATFTSGSGPVTVRDNDPSYFEFANIGTQAPGVAFPVTINARSSGNDVVTAYTSTAALSASAGGTALPMTPTATTGFSNGAWTGNVTVNGSGGAVRLTATRTGTGAFGNSNSFTVTGTPLAPPTVTTPTATSITATGATLGGNVTADGGAGITERGVVYAATATNNDPLIDGLGVTKVTATGTTGVFTAPVTGLTQGTGYSYKAYAINSQGTTYTSVATFTSLSTNADLSALTLSSGTLSPTFASGTTAYTASVTNATTSITVTPTRTQANATIEARVNTGTYAAVTSGSPSASLPLNVGTNTVDVRVTAQDGTTQKTYTVTVTRDKVAQTITFANPGAQLANATVNLSAEGGASGEDVTFTVEGPATLVGNVLSFTGAGSVTVRANQDGNNLYHPAPEVARTFPVTKASATVTLVNLSQTYNGTPKSATATTDPVGKTVTFTYEGSSTVPTNAGSYAVVGTIDDPIYEGSANGTLSIARAAQTIIFPNPGPQPTNATVTLSATGGGSGNPVTFAVTSGPASISNGVLSFTGPGNVTITANQIGNANYEDAVEVSHTFTVSKPSATITLSRLHQVADGTARDVVVTTVPEDLEIEVTYDGNVDAPTTPGSYAVVAASADDRYEGSASGTLVVDDPARAVRVPGGSLPALSALGELTVPTFSIGAYEVTGSQWAAVVAWAEANAGYDFAGAGSGASGDRPVTGISWFDAAKWCNARTEWENALLGKSLAPAYQVAGAVYKTGTPASPADLTCDFGAGGYRLPTAAEWEYAARGGASGVPATYPGGNTLDDLGWYTANSNGAVQPAGGKTANGLGLYDLAGNAAEWTWDAPVGSPAQRLLRGGAWSSAASACELTALSGETPAQRLDRSGFRITRSISLALTTALDAPDLAWESGGDEAWFAQITPSQDGSDSAESGAVGPGQSSWLETSVTGPCKLRFRWEASQRSGLDVFRLETGTGDPILLTGPGDWEERLIELPAGDHTLRWVFARDAASTGPSRVRLDAVSVTPATLPTVTTAAASEVSGSGATLGGEVTAEGGRTVTARGVVYSTSPGPTLASPGVLTEASGGKGTFSVAATGLTEGTTYFARAYATNNFGTAYGAEILLTTDTTVALTDGIGTVTGRSIVAGDTQRFRFRLAFPSVAAFATSGLDSATWELRDGNGIVVASGNGNVDLDALLISGNHVLSIASTGTNTQSFALNLDASVEARPRPDVSLGETAAETDGSDVYSPAMQNVTVLSRRAVARMIFASVGNDGPLPDVMKLQGSPGNGHFAVSYFSGSANLTAQIIAGTHTTVVMDGDDPTLQVTVTVTPNKRKIVKRVLRGGKRVTTYLRRTYYGFIEATAGSDAALSDTVRFQVTTTR